MQNLQYILDILKGKRKKEIPGVNFYIPEAWNHVNYQKGSSDPNRPGETRVDPDDFYTFCIEDYIIANSKTARARLNSQNREPSDGPLNLSEELYKNVIYSMFLRTFTAWNHYDKGTIYSGTFLKAIGLLPYLRDLGVSIVYLLPVFEVSEKYKKGELGSPYAIKNIYRLDPALHDGLLGEESDSLLEAEFKAFIEACHLLDIKVMADFVFRTVSRDNDLLVEHPDWFYWIHHKYNDTFSPPVVEKVKKLTTLHDKTLKLLYTCTGIAEFLNKFTYSPRETNPGKWEQVVTRYQKSKENILDLIEKEFELTTVPGFSDVLNDPQPPWADVTYLKFYHDIHAKARKYVRKGQPPYVLQDVACLNLYQGNEPNTQLWDYVAQVIPYYQENFGIDGARIDMGHALPPELNREIVKRIKERNQDFLLWSEEFNVENSKEAKKDGFHFITGNLWHVFKDVERPRFCKRLFRTIFNSTIAVTGAMETPDTPRAAFVYKDLKKLELLILLNYFIPNSVPFINNGMELMELQPMNLGLDNTEAGRLVLNPEEPMYGKLAFFDNYRFHWLSDNRKWMEELLKKAFSLRRQFQEIIKKEYLVSECGSIKNKKIIFLHYNHNHNHNRPDLFAGQGRDLIFLANRDFKNRARVNLKSLIKKEYRNNLNQLRIVYAGGVISDQVWETSPASATSRLVNPGEVIIGFN